MAEKITALVAINVRRYVRVEIPVPGPAVIRLFVQGEERDQLRYLSDLNDDEEEASFAVLGWDHETVDDMFEDWREPSIISTQLMEEA